MKKPKIVKHISTIGLDVEINGKPLLCRVAFDKMEDGTVKAYIISGRTLAKLDKMGTVTLTHQEFADMPEDPYNDLVFARSAFSLFGLSV